MSGSGRLIFKDKCQLESKNFHFGFPNGIGKIVLPEKQFAKNKSYIEGNFNNGCFNGLVKGFQYLPEDGILDSPSFEPAKINYLAIYNNGFVKGTIHKPRGQ